MFRASKKQIRKEARYEAAFNLLIAKSVNCKRSGYRAIYEDDVREVLAVAGLSMPEIVESEDKDV